MGQGNRVFTESQASLLKDVINRIVPAEEEFPGAGDLGLASYIDSAALESAKLKRLFLTGLAHIEIVASRAMGQDFGDLSGEDKDRVLMRVEEEQPDFFRALVQYTYNGYYTNPAIFPLIGYEGHPPQPQGYDMEPFDPRLLDIVRKRSPMYREVSLLAG